MWSKFQKTIRNYFGYTASEANGMIVVFGIMAILLLLPTIQRIIFADSQHYDSSRDQEILDSLLVILNKPSAEKTGPVDKINLHSFDPNTASVDTLKSLGIPFWLAARIEKYRKAGGEFRAREDLLDIYDFPQDLYEQLEEHISIPKATTDADIADNRYGSPPKTEEKKTERFEFDPNTVSIDEMEKLGFPDWLAKRIEKYRAKGGVFKTSESLKKIYGFPQDLYNDLESYIEISQDNIDEEVERNSPRTIKAFDINEADSSQLTSISGIGNFYASQILRLRNQLGGFVSEDQLHEVYRIDSSTVNRLLPHIYISDNYRPAKINVNTADEAALARHPYISWKQAKLIVAYRKQHNIRSVKDLRKIKPLSEEDIRKMAPYLSY